MSHDQNTSARRPTANPRHSTNSELLTVGQAADYLNINEAFVRRLVHERRLPFLKVGRLVRLRQSALDEWLTASEVPALRPARGSRRWNKVS